MDHPEWINKLSTIEGLGAIHIAIFMQNVPIIYLLLEYGADPNLRDRCDNTPAHCAVQIGNIEILKTLYATGKCNFNDDLPNKFGQKLLDIASRQLSKDEIKDPIVHMYGDWCPDQWSFTAMKVEAGRLKCKEYISAVLKKEYEDKRTTSVKHLIENMSVRQHAANVLRGSVTANDKRYITRNDYPKNFTSSDWTERDISFFNQHQEDVDKVTHCVFMRDFASRVIRSGCDDVKAHILRTRSSRVADLMPINDPVI